MTLVELIAALVSALAVWLTARRHPWCWPIGLASVALYGWVFVHARLYSDALLQGAFAVMLVYGWVHWRRHLDVTQHVRVARLAPTAGAWHLAVGAVGAVLLGYVMHRWTDAALPWLDAALTAFSLVAQWWQARRHIAAWPLWIAVDVAYVGEYVFKDLGITAVLYAGFLVLAVVGWRAWRQVPETLVDTRSAAPH